MIANSEDIAPTEAQVQNRWKRINKNFRKSVDYNNISGNKRKECPKFGY